MIKLSVIIPFYGVEKYNARCTDSLMPQTMKDDIEFIFINDATEDSSLDVLKKVLSEYPEQKEQVSIILYHEKKQRIACCEKYRFCCCKRQIYLPL